MLGKRSETGKTFLTAILLLVSTFLLKTIEDFAKLGVSPESVQKS
jgi:hypothetical protein